MNCWPKPDRPRWAGNPAEAVAFGDVVLLAVSWAAVREVIEQAGPWTSKILIDATNRLTPPTPDDAPSAGEDVARWAKDARVVKAFNATGSVNMTAAPYGAQKVDIYLCSDDAQAKAVVANLIASSGFELGGLRAACQCKLGGIFGQAMDAARLSHGQRPEHRV